LFSHKSSQRNRRCPNPGVQPTPASGRLTPNVGHHRTHLRRSLEQCPRHVVIVYYHPMCKQVFEEAGFLQKVEVLGDRAPVATYESIVVAQAGTLRMIQAAREI
jgi:hypothetical protein